MGAPIFRTAAGRLTGYALACGYIEKRQLQGYDDASVTLWLEHGALHVRAHDSANHCRLFWHCPESIGEARAFYDLAESICSATAPGVIGRG